MNVLRSLLFVPGSRPERFGKAVSAGADMVCIDLEDAVLPSDKSQARADVVEFIKDSANRKNNVVCVRINPLDTELGHEDLAQLAAVNPDFIMLAKCASAEQIKQANDLLEKQSTKLIGLIETIEGLENASEIAQASDRVAALMFGGADMSAELRCEFSYEPLLFARSQLVQAAAKAKIHLLDVPFIDIKNNDGLLAETAKIKALGFTAKAAIHPCQIKAIHTAFAPSEEEVAFAKSVLSAVDSEDAGVVVVNGKMIDRPVILSCKRIMELAQAPI